MNAKPIQWFPGHMAKTRRIMKESIKHVDAVVELLDARIPISSRNPEFSVLTERKPKIVLLNKMDLADEKINKEWENYYKSIDIPVLSADSQSGKGLDKFEGVVNLAMDDLLKYRVGRGIKGKAVRLMIVGIPNVGKSSLINRLAKSKITNVADKPGVTRIQQWVTTDMGLEILDTPGVLWPKFEDQEVGRKLVYTGAIKDDIMDIESLGMMFLEYLAKNYPKSIEERYKMEIEEDMNGYDLLELLGRKRGMLQSGGRVNTERAAATLFDEYRAGTLGRISFERPADLVNLAED